MSYPSNKQKYTALLAQARKVLTDQQAYNSIVDGESFRNYQDKVSGSRKIIWASLSTLKNLIDSFESLPTTPSSNQKPKGKKKSKKLADGTQGE